MVTKLNRGIFPILDLKSLNRFLCIEKLWMETTKSNIFSQTWEISVIRRHTLQDVFLYIPIFPSHQHFMPLTVADQHSVALPFMLSPPSQVFTKYFGLILALLPTKSIQGCGLREWSWYIWAGGSHEYSGRWGSATTTWTATGAIYVLQLCCSPGGHGKTGLVRAVGMPEKVVGKNPVAFIERWRQGRSAL